MSFRSFDCKERPQDLTILFVSLVACMTYAEQQSVVDTTVLQYARFYIIWCFLPQKSGDIKKGLPLFTIFIHYQYCSDTNLVENWHRPCLSATILYMNN